MTILDNPDKCDADSTVVASAPDEWWHPYLAKYVAHVGAPARSFLTHHHFYSFMHALARKFPAEMEWQDGGRDRRWWISPPELDGRKCYLPGTECDSICWSAFADAIEAIDLGWLTVEGFPRRMVDSEGNAVHHDPIAELLTIAGEAGEDVAALEEQVRSHAVASGQARKGRVGADAPRSPSAEILCVERTNRRRTRKRVARRKPDAQAETGNLFGAA